MCSAVALENERTLGWAVCRGQSRKPRVGWGIVWKPAPYGAPNRDRRERRLYRGWPIQGLTCLGEEFRLYYIVNWEQINNSLAAQSRHLEIDSFKV